MDKFLFRKRRVYTRLSKSDVLHLMAGLEYWLDDYPKIAERADDEEIDQLFKDYYEMGELWSRLNQMISN